MIKESGDAGLFDFEEELNNELAGKQETKEEPAKETIAKEDKPSGIGTVTMSEFEKGLKEETDEDEDEDENSDEESEETQEKKEEEKPKKEDKKKEEEEVEVKTPAVSFKGLAAYLHDEGIVDFEDSKDIEDSPELLLDLVNNRVDNEIKSYKESLPEIVSELVDYIEKGGDPEKFLGAVNKEIDLESLDLENESNQELLVREYLKSQDHTKDEIDELISDYKEALVLEKQAKFASKKIEKIQEGKKEALIKEQEAIVEEQKARVETYKTNVKNTIFSSNELAGLPVTKKEKEDFSKYLLEVNPKTGLTKYQEAVNKNPLQTQVELAYLKYKEFDFSKVEKKAKSDAAKDIRDRIFTKTESTPKGKTKVSEGERNFEAFKAAFGRS